jgi:methionine aminopeptidase
MIPIYPHRKQIKINYETQFSIDPMLNDEIEKKTQLKKDTKNNSS